MLRRALPGPHRAVVESTASWYWVRDLLVTAGIDLRLGHSKYIKAISYAKVNADAVDAATLAQLLRSDLIPEAHMVSAEWRDVRDLCGPGSSSSRSACGARTRCGVSSRGTTWRRPRRCRPSCNSVWPCSEQQQLLTRQARQLVAALTPRLIPTPDVQRLV